MSLRYVKVTELADVPGALVTADLFGATLIGIVRYAFESLDNVRLLVVDYLTGDEWPTRPEMAKVKFLKRA
jgi:hypothetical protein